jgi:hypothetical protein
MHTRLNLPVTQQMVDYLRTALELGVRLVPGHYLRTNARHPNCPKTPCNGSCPAIQAEQVDRRRVDESRPESD